MSTDLILAEPKDLSIQTVAAFEGIVFTDLILAEPNDLSIQTIAAFELFG